MPVSDETTIATNLVRLTLSVERNTWLLEDIDGMASWGDAEGGDSWIAVRQPGAEDE